MLKRNSPSSFTALFSGREVKESKKVPAKVPRTSLPVLQGVLQIRMVCGENESDSLSCPDQKPKVAQLRATSPARPVSNTALGLSKNARRASTSSTASLSHRDISLLLCERSAPFGCHVPGCHESGRRDTESRSRCEPHAFNSESRPQNHQPLKSNHSLTLQSAVFHQQVILYPFFFPPTTK